MTGDGRQKALEILKAQIKLQKARIDPDVLARASQAAEQHSAALQASPPPAAPPAPASQRQEPYDRAAAAKTIELFLKNHDSSRDFQKRLLEFMKKTQH